MSMMLYGDNEKHRLIETMSCAIISHTQMWLLNIANWRITMFNGQNNVSISSDYDYHLFLGAMFSGYVI